mmetsp:Transcript_30429/g.39265  ORF Transcript_30429/g.39265 Transcript_30429/m.39265 type:complete len:373 (+) Transcript_30429:96-1214(+)
MFYTMKQLTFLLFAGLFAMAAAFQGGFMPQGSLQASFYGNSVVDVLPTSAPAAGIVMDGKSNAIRDRIKSVKNTRKITEAMRLVAAAKVRRAQDAVLKTRPFNEALQKIFRSLSEKIGAENIDLPLLKAREVNKVLLVAISGDRGLCGGYNSYAIKRTEARIAELESAGLDFELITVGKKISTYFNRRIPEKIAKTYECGQAPTGADASEISQLMLASFLGGEADAVELVYTRFVSLIASNPSLKTMLPLTASGIESATDEIFELSSADGEFDVKRTEIAAPAPYDFPPELIFEQDPLAILNAILPLYLNGQVLRSLQESVASELAARMTAMQAASDNAKSLQKDLSLQYNRARQAAVTQEILEIVSGAAAL